MNWEHLERGSSPVDWCEENYLFSSNIAEFFNTISNILFFILPPLLIHLFKEYARYINPGIHVIWILLFVVGASSAYFHATLSLLGQLLDEVAIIWVFMTAATLFYPSKYLPFQMSKNRNQFVVIMFIFTLIATCMSMYHPAVNAFVLMFLAIPAVMLLAAQIKSETNMRVYRLGLRCMLSCALAVTCWINDRLFCDAWHSLNFPYLHGIWHILIFIASYTACVLFAYYMIKNEFPERVGVLKYWPRDDFEYGIPYVAVKYHYRDLKDNI